MKARVLTIMVAGVLGVGSAVALANNGGGGNRSERGQGAPGYVCKKQGLTPGSKEFKACVQDLAHKRGRGHTTSTSTGTTGTTTASTTSATHGNSHRGH
jgi:hypothetical protein